MLKFKFSIIFDDLLHTSIDDVAQRNSSEVVIEDNTLENAISQLQSTLAETNKVLISVTLLTIEV